MGSSESQSSSCAVYMGLRLGLHRGGFPEHLEVSFQCLKTSLLSCQEALDYGFSLASFPMAPRHVARDKEIVVGDLFTLLSVSLWPVLQRSGSVIGQHEYLGNSVQRLLLLSR